MSCEKAKNNYCLFCMCENQLKSPSIFSRPKLILLLFFQMDVLETNDPLELENLDNPWSVSDLSEFLKYCCPECDFKDINVQVFSNHAKISHKNASTFFQNENIIENDSSHIEEEETKFSLSESFKETQSELESTFKIELPDETIEDVELQLDDSYVESNYEQGIYNKGRFNSESKHLRQLTFSNVN